MKLALCILLFATTALAFSDTERGGYAPDGYVADVRQLLPFWSEEPAPEEPAPDFGNLNTLNKPATDEGYYG